MRRIGRVLAERVGFEPTVEFPLHTLSKRAPSTTRTSLRLRINELRAAWNSVAQDAPSNLVVQELICLQRFAAERQTIVSGIVSGLLMSSITCGDLLEVP